MLYLNQKATRNRMGFSRKLAIAVHLAAALWAVFLPQFAFAYDHPLSDEAVRDAYFVGQDVKNVNHFLAPYTQSLPVPDSGPDVSEIALSTPYAQVVEVSAQHSVGLQRPAGGGGLSEAR